MCHQHKRYETHGTHRVMDHTLLRTGRSHAAAHIGTVHTLLRTVSQIACCIRGRAMSYSRPARTPTRGRAAALGQARARASRRAHLGGGEGGGEGVAARGVLVQDRLRVRACVRACVQSVRACSPRPTVAPLRAGQRARAVAIRAPPGPSSPPRGSGASPPRPPRAAGRGPRLEEDGPDNRTSNRLLSRNINYYE